MTSTQQCRPLCLYLLILCDSGYRFDVVPVHAVLCDSAIMSPLDIRRSSARRQLLARL